MNHPKIVPQLASYLKRNGKKQYEFAAEIGAPPQTIHRWLSGKSKVSRAYQVLLRAKGIID